MTALLIVCVVGVVVIGFILCSLRLKDRSASARGSAVVHPARSAAEPRGSAEVANRDSAVRPEPVVPSVPCGDGPPSGAPHSLRPSERWHATDSKPLRWKADQ